MAFKSNISCVLALDIGTSGVRAALYDERGDEIEGTEAMLARTPRTTADGGVEFDAEEEVERTARIIDEICARSATLAPRIEAVAVSCFWHSLIGVDGAGQAVTPVLTWADTRAASVVGELQNSFDEREMHARTGCRFHASYWPAKILWLRREQRATFNRVVRWLSFSDFLFERFLGCAATSISMASGTGLFNQNLCAWDEELLERLGVSPERVPVVAHEEEAISALTETYARRWPQLAEARWFPAIGDGAVNNVGAGCTTRERMCLMVGTSGAMRVLWEGDAPAVLPPALWCYRADGRRVVAGGALSDGGLLYGWMREALNLRGDDEQVAHELAAMEPDAHGLTLLPFWSGERSTGWHAAARGAILGLTAHTRPAEILRAAMEAVAYRFALIKDALDGFAMEASVIAAGGALRSSAVWMQMMADVLGCPVTLSGVREASSRGAVLLALEAFGKIDDIAARAALQTSEQTFLPDMTRHERYREALARQQELYQRLVSDIEKV